MENESTALVPRVEGQIPVRIKKWRDGLEFAAALVKSGLTKGRGIDTPERALMVILAGQEMGVGPVRSLRSFFVTPQGGLGIEGQIMLACFGEKGGDYEWLDCTTETASIRLKWKGREHTETFTMEDAARAELTSSKGSSGSRQDGKPYKDNWRRYPQIMLRWRAAVIGIRFIAPEIFGGFISEHEAEEISDVSRSGQVATDEKVASLTERIRAERKEPERVEGAVGELLTVCPECGQATKTADLADVDTGRCMWCAEGLERSIDLTKAVKEGLEAEAAQETATASANPAPDEGTEAGGSPATAEDGGPETPDLEQGEAFPDE